MKAVCVVFAAVLAAACANSPSDSAAPAAAAPRDPASLGTITGTVVVDGQVPAAEVIRLDGDPKCLALANGEERRAEAVVTGAGNTLKNAFVYVAHGLTPQMHQIPNTPVVLDQDKCRYTPRVLGVQVGQPLVIKNSDPLLHNVRAEGAINEPFDIGTPVQGMEVKRTFATREVMVPFKCNVHAWMNAYVGVLEHPYFAVSDSNGQFSLPPLPAGTYTVEVWHEQFGVMQQQVNVSANAEHALRFTFRAS